MWQLDVISAHLFGVGSWMGLADHGVRRWPLDVVGCPRVCRWHLNVVGAHVYGGVSWKWLVSTCVAVAVGCGWVPKCVVMAIVYDWYPLVWWCQLDVVCNRVCGSGSWVWLGAHACGGDS